MSANTVVRVASLLQQYDSPTACAAEVLCDRHDPEAVAFTVVEPDLSHRDLTYGYLRAESAKFAAALADLGVAQGDNVAVLMSKSAELVIALLGIWRRGAVHVPLFTAFAAPAIAMRLQASSTRLVIADAGQVDKVTAAHRLVDDGDGDGDGQIIVVGGHAPVGVLSFESLMTTHTATDPAGAAVAVGGAGVLVRLFTSGTTGTPKAVPVPLRALAAFQAYFEMGLDVRDDDVLWNAADPGWAYGLYWGILSPLSAGQPNILLHAGFSADLTWAVCEKFGVTNFASAPTVYRTLRTSTTPVPAGLRLRCASSAGEPLTPEVVSWARDALGVEVRDHFGQTETGMTIVNGWHDDVIAPVKEGSMGRAVPGFVVAVLDENDKPALARTVGRVAISVDNSPLMTFHGYADAPERTAERFTADRRWYLTGDMASMDDDGDFFFSGRDDDVIIMAGYRIGPFDVESVLLTHPSVAEAAAVGVPDDLRGEVLEAFVVLRDLTDAGDDLIVELQQLVKQKFAAHAYPRAVHFVPELPKTPSGKVQRVLLRKQRAAELQPT